MTKRNFIGSIKYCIGQVPLLLFLVLYLVGSSNLEILHSIVHEHKAKVTHSAEQEHDPCHRSIFHGDIEQGCKHDSHFIESDKCSMCDQVFHGDQINLDQLDLNNIEFSSSPFSLIKTRVDSHSAVITSSRAPPTIA